jgi:type II secretory pathway component PulF
MEDQLLLQRLDALEKKIDATYHSAEKMRKYFLWTLILTVVAFVLPLFGLIFAIPQFLSYYQQIGQIGSLG